MRVLIVGGTKFIGPPLVRHLVRQGHEVAVFHRGQTEADLPPSVTRILGDRRDLPAYAAAFRRFAPDVAVDMLAFSEADARSFAETFRGLARRAVVLSSGDVYRAYGRLIGLEPGPPEPVPIPEDAPLRTKLFPHRRPETPPDDRFHDYEKILVERAVTSVPDLPATVLRLPMVYGEGDDQRRLRDYVRRIDDERPVVLGERTAAWRCSRGYVGDVAAAIALAVTDGRATGRTYNVGEAVASTEAEWVRRIASAAGRTVRIVTVPQDRLPMPLDVAQDLVTDTDRLRIELGSAEVTPPDEALRRSVEWEQAQPVGEMPDYAAEDALVVEFG